MARRARVTVSNLVFHVMARGNHRETTFCDSSDYRAYLNRLERYQRRYRVRLYAYCLMPNHVHFLARTFDVPLGKFMQATQQSYTQRYNRRHATVGHLFQGRYKAIVCDRDDYIVALLRYIHLNPVRAGLVERPEEYAYSGHSAYLRGERSALLDPTPLLDLLGGPEGYRRLLRDDLEGRVPMGTMNLGDPRLELDGWGTGTGRGTMPISLGRVTASPPMALVIQQLARQAGVTPEGLCRSRRSRAISLIRTAILYVLLRRFGYRAGDVAAAFGLPAASVSSMVSRFASRPDSSLLIGALVKGLGQPPGSSEECQDYEA